MMFANYLHNSGLIAFEFCVFNFGYYLFCRALVFAILEWVLK